MSTGRERAGNTEQLAQSVANAGANTESIGPQESEPRDPGPFEATDFISGDRCTLLS